jgi:redox-sensitive bicupin YhaK (pirin superfamily)
MCAYMKVLKLIKGRRTSDGPGVRLTRMFANNNVVETDPFLLFDLFGSNRADEYIAGFPPHPHRGIETVTYMLDGYVDHKDSTGNKGTIGPGDVQWMTAGSGTIHEEMPRRSDGWMRGLQLWVNLPRSSKMAPPKYRGIVNTDIPTLDLGNGSSVKVLSGDFNGTNGPIHDLAVNIEYLDVHLAPTSSFEHNIPNGMNTFVAVYEGSVTIDDTKEVVPESVALLSDGDLLKVKSGKNGAKFLLVSGTPLREPIAWGGPIVMNTEEELNQAFGEIRNHTFIKKAR